MKAGASKKKILLIDGEAFSTLEEFAEHFSKVVLEGHWWWNGNLDAFNDILRGGFGTPGEGFILRWKNAEVSRRRLGYSETVRQLQMRLERCHPTNKARVSRELEDAKHQTGPTVFDWLVDIIKDHGPGGSEKEDGIELVLE